MDHWIYYLMVSVAWLVVILSIIALTIIINVAFALFLNEKTIKKDYTPLNNDLHEGDIIYYHGYKNFGVKILKIDKLDIKVQSLRDDTIFGLNLNIIQSNYSHTAS